MNYLVLCKDRINGYALWWRANRSGYTNDVLQAGRYTKDEAESIARIRGSDFPVPESDVGGVIKVRRIVSVEDGDNFDALNMYERSQSSAEANGSSPQKGE